MAGGVLKRGGSRRGAVSLASLLGAVVFALLAAIAVVSLLGKLPKRPPEVSPEESAGFDPSRDAGADIKSAVFEARRTGRRVFIEVGGNWCVWCHRLQAFFAAQPELHRLLESLYVVVKVSVSPENPNTALLARFPPISSYPHFLILDQEGALLVSRISDDFEAHGDGYDSAKFRAFLLQWARAR